MAIKIKTFKDKIPSMVKTFEAIHGKKIQVGVFDGDTAWLAHIHEYGCDIKAKRAKYLTVPVNPKAKGKRAGEFKDLYFIEDKDGDKFLVRNVGKDKIEFMYWLTEWVKIPERSFLRSGFDKNIDNVNKTIDKLMNSLVNGNLTEDEFCDIVGKTMASKIKTYARDLSTPANASVTSEAKGSSNPLIDTGQMIRDITWKVKD